MGLVQAGYTTFVRTRIRVAIIVIAAVTVAPSASGARVPVLHLGKPDHYLGVSTPDGPFICSVWVFAKAGLIYRCVRAAHGPSA